MPESMVFMHHFFKPVMLEDSFWKRQMVVNILKKYLKAP